MVTLMFVLLSLNQVNEAIKDNVTNKHATKCNCINVHAQPAVCTHMKSECL